MTSELVTQAYNLSAWLKAKDIDMQMPGEMVDPEILWDEITRLTAALAAAKKRPLAPKVIAELIRGKVARMGRLEEMQENTRFYSEGDWSVTPGNIPRATKPCIVIRLTEDEAAALDAMVKP